MIQGVRPSQFILVYGPGAILEGERGPRIIPDAQRGLFGQHSKYKPDDYRIDDERMSRGLLGGAQIYRLPTNPELGHDGYIYRTKEFPKWRLCVNLHGHGGSLLYDEEVCPMCKSGGGRDAIGFVMACRDGHLDEVPWIRLVHDRADCDKSRDGSIHPDLRRKSILWRRRGGTLSDVRLECPRCGRNKIFGDVYYREQRCDGRHPHKEGLGAAYWNGVCAKSAKIIARQASNIRLAETRTLLSIQAVHTNLRHHLQNNAIDAVFRISKPDSKEAVVRILDDLSANRNIGKGVADEFRQAGWEEIKQAMDDATRGPPNTYHGLVMDEFRELMKASVRGAPPQNEESRESAVLFEVDPQDRRTARTKNGTAFKVTPIQTLRTVTVQTGFRRDIPERDSAGTQPNLVKNRYKDEAGVTWFPGVEFFGEGLFIRPDADGGWADSMKGESREEWMAGLRNADSYDEFVFRDAGESRDELNPGFVWWHTLAHLLIRTISEEAGYSPASMRERIYFEADGARCRGGILLYATQPGSEGTLGGLIALAPHMEKFLRISLDKAKSCSGDPLCGEARFRANGYDGASCYACLMNSETSCEHRNMWLDRHVLMENMP